MNGTVGSNGLRQGLRPRPIPIGPASIAALVEILPSRDDPALIDREATLTYREVIELTNATAAGLHSVGVVPGSVVAVAAPNLNDLIIAFLAVQRLGAIWVGINRALAPPEKATQLKDSGTSFFLGDAQSVAQIEQLRGQLGALVTILTMSAGESDLAKLIDRYRGKRAPAALPDPHQPAAISYTSGTTGSPKGVVHSQHSIMTYVNACLNSDEGGQWIPGRRRSLTIPLTIMNGMIYGPVVALAGGGSFVSMDRIDAEGVAEWIDTHAVEVLNSTPTTVRDLLYRPDLQRFKLTSLTAVAVGGSPPPPDVLAAFRSRFGFEMIVDYGLMESPSSIASSLPTEAPEAGATGKAHLHVRMAIMDQHGNILPPNTEGELCVTAPDSGPWAGVYTGMLGYWNKPEETAQAFHGTWLRTGDMATLDGRGIVSIVGRKKEMILRGGANIYPAEVENVLRLHDTIEDVVVSGFPDERLGEIVAAYIVLKPGVAPSSELADELRAYALTQVARYKAPERWFVVESIPRNALNKPLRSLLSEMPQTELVAA